MLVKMGKADCLLGGATYSTADTVRPALQLIKCKPGIKSVSSCFIMVRGDEKLAMGDCAINIDPSEDEIVESTVETAHTAEIFGIDPKVALLSYSTKGSGKGETVDKMRNATLRVQEAHPELKVDGELQFDAAVAPEVGKLKAPNSTVAGEANVGDHHRRHGIRAPSQRNRKRKARPVQRRGRLLRLNWFCKKKIFFALALTNEINWNNI